MTDLLFVYKLVASEHREAIETAREDVARGVAAPMASALVAIDEAMRDFSGDVGMT